MTNNVNIYVDQGTDFSVSIDVNTTGGVDYDVTGHTFFCDVKRVYAETKQFSPLLTPFQDPSTGNWILNLDIPRSMTADITPGRFQYDIMMVSPSGIASKILDGIMFIMPTTTRVTA